MPAAAKALHPRDADLPLPRPFDERSAKYRTKEEVDKYRNERDPIDHVRKILLEEKMTDEAALKAVDADIRKIVNDAAEFAQHSPEPDR